MIIITELKKVGRGCPAVWEGKTNDGLAVLIYYRWGHLTVDLEGDERLPFSKQVASDHAGCMEFEELRRHLLPAKIYLACCEEENS